MKAWRWRACERGGGTGQRSFLRRGTTCEVKDVVAVEFEFDFEFATHRICNTSF